VQPVATAGRLLGGRWEAGFDVAGTQQHGGK
jgi:hypothetical protein